MSGDCFSFDTIPHVSGLFRDYLYHFDKVQAFYDSKPDDRASLLERARHLRERAQFSAVVADVLERQNRGFGASQKVLDNIARLRKGAVAAVSGQQVGLFGGPLYTIFKAVSALRLARDLSAQGVECMPVFWLATEDHDLEEVNHVTLLNAAGKPERLQTSSAGAHNAPMFEVRLGNEIGPVVRRASELLGEGNVTAALGESYRPGESMGTAFAKLFARLFADFGLILLDPSDPELHALAAPIYAKAIAEAESLNAGLLQRGRELRAAGYHEQVKVTPETTLLFEKRDGARTVIHRSNGGFSIGRDRASRDELLAALRSWPQRFSPNVLLRPVVQDYLLPTAAYFAGPAEVAYFAQVEVVYRRLLGRVTPVLPRFSATLLDARAQRLMKQHALGLEDLFEGADAVRAKIAARQLPPALTTQFESGSTAASDVVHLLTATLEKLDPTLVRSARRTERRILFELERLRRRAANAELRRNSEIATHAEWLIDNLFPHKQMQEREIAGLTFVARYGRELIERLIEACGNCRDHQLISL
jgi:bacillithiol biosynthesis cysteine-adding enzyme BshC